MTAAVTLRRSVVALLLAALILASLSDCTIWERTADPVTKTGVVTIPCRPVNGECTGTADIPPGTRLVILEPGDGAGMVARQVRDLRRRTP